MKYEIVHLTDFHINKNFNYNDFVKAMLDSLIFEDDEINSTIVLCITGDLVQSCENRQYVIFDKFLKFLKTELENNGKKLEVLLVPGNHDIDLSNIDKKRSEKIRKAIDSNDLDNLLKSDLEKMNNFFNFANKYDCFTDNKYASQRKIEFTKDDSLNFLLLNTACFSSLKKDDKDIHFIPSSFLTSVNFKDENVITLMHHSCEWFDEKCQNDIENICKSSIFYLFGHSHKVDTYHTEGGLGFLNDAINPTDFKLDRYSIFLLDIKNDKLEQIKVEYDVNEKKFIRKEEISQIRIFSNILKLNNPNSKHCYKEKNSYTFLDAQKVELDDVFVFPLISKSDDSTINDFDTLTKYIEEKRNVLIDGQNGSGTTTLLKKIFNTFLETKKIILFVDEENENNITNNFDKSIRNLFFDNYGDRQFNSFTQEIKENKVIIIDNIDINKNEKNKNFIKNCFNEFGYVVFSLKNNFESRKDLLEEYLLVDITKIKIEAFTRYQRNLLINKVANYYKQNSKIKEINNCIESIISSEAFFNLTTPDNLILLVNQIIKEKYYEERDTKDSFSIVFEGNIYNKIKNVIGENNADDGYVLLREIAYKMFCKEKNESYYIYYDEIIEALKECKENWSIRLDERDMMILSSESNLIKKEAEKYLFVKNSYYAFFVAKYIVDKINNEEDMSSDINKLLSNITFGNYGDILLFIAYFKHSNSFFKSIISEINDITNSWNLLSFDESNHYILKRISKDGMINHNNFENKKHYEERMDSQEKKIIKKEENISNEKKYTLQEDDEFNNIIKTIKLLEILSKGISGYKHLIKKEFRKNMLDTTINGLYKVIYRLFDFSNEEYEMFYNEFVNNIIKNNNDISKFEINKRVTNILYNILSTFTLNIITGICNICVTKNSIELIDEIIDQDNENIIFNNVLIKCICLERYGNENKFTNYILYIYDKLKKNDQKDMIIRIVHFFAISKGINYQNLEKLCNKLNLSKEKIMLLNPESNKLMNDLTKKIANR